MPPQAADAARDTVAGALAAAESLPPALADAVLEPARAAFSSGLVVAGLAGAALLTTVAVFAVTRLQHPSGTPGTETGRQHDEERS